MCLQRGKHELTEQKFSTVEVRDIYEAFSYIYIVKYLCKLMAY